MLRDITIGRYLEKSSPIHDADARTKIISAFAFSVMVFTFDSPAATAVLAALCTIAIIIAKIPLRYAIKGLKPLRWFILFTIIVNIFTCTGNTIWQWKVFHITDQGIITAVKTAIKFVLFISGTSLLTLTTPPLALTDGVSRLMHPLQKIGIPTEDIAMIISVTLRFIPTFADEAEKIMKAQRARGADFSGKGIAKIKAVIPVTVPLFVSAMRRSTELALAMDSRCYGKGTRRSRNKTVFSIKDLVIFSVMISALIFLGIFQILH